jgi:hypothetical protein
MMLEARSRSCFSSAYVLKLDGRPVGEYAGRFWTSVIDVRMVGRRRFRFDRRGWLSSRYRLVDSGTGREVDVAEPAGWLTSAWTLQLADGPASMVSAGWCTPAYRVMRGGIALGEVDTIGTCESGWYARGRLALPDLLIVGLIYHTILERRRQEASD